MITGDGISPMTGNPAGLQHARGDGSRHPVTKSGMRQKSEYKEQGLISEGTVPSP
jgi:hypothetical protein